MSRKRRDPQEKKRLSYALDCRDAYGENDKGRRKTVPNAKARANRAARRAGMALLVEDPDAACAQHRAKMLKRWKKAPDAPLGQVVGRQAERREARVGRKALSRARPAAQQERDDDV
ncbi:hypothetical protein [Sagittula sp. S175]|uniref:hypothetical protein n=1 Tax=Sagittula sp. S175 TaxID=3415129 RepID=UPI003C7E89C7